MDTIIEEEGNIRRSLGSFDEMYIVELSGVKEKLLKEINRRGICHEEKILLKCDNEHVNGTPINPDELELIYKEGAVGVHDLFKQHGVSISYKAADLLWCDYSQDIFKCSCEQFPTKEVVMFKDYAQKLFVSLYLYNKKIITTPDDWCEVDFALCKILKMDI